MPRIALIFLASLALSGCGTYKSTSGIIPVDGGSVELEGEAALTVAAGTFSQDTNFVLEQRRVNEFEDELESTSLMVGDEVRKGTPLRVTIAAEQPVKPIVVSLKIPSSISKNNESASDIAIFAASETESDLSGPFPYFDMISGTVSSNNSVVTFSADPAHFVQSSEDGKELFGVFIVASEKNR